jgi:sulfopyruvate decarboxylase
MWYLQSKSKKKTGRSRLSTASLYFEKILKKHKIEKLGYLPCDRLKVLIEYLSTSIPLWNLTRESAGIGLNFGWHLGGKRGGMLIQSTGLGNLITELITLPVLYNSPLPVFVSWRGHGTEAIEAQTILGRKIPSMLSGLGFPFSEIVDFDDMEKIDQGLSDCYATSAVHVFLLSPMLWEKASFPERVPVFDKSGPRLDKISIQMKSYKGTPEFSRYSAIKLILETIDPQTVVVCQLGYPSREAFHIKDGSRNFYLLGALGSATLVGIGLAEARPDLNVMVLDGDGSYIFNPNQFFELALEAPENLTVVILDNGAWGSTGSQPTLSAAGLNLSAMGAAAGADKWRRVSRQRDWNKAMAKGERRIHYLIQPGNAPVPTIPLKAIEIKERFLSAIKK